MRFLLCLVILSWSPLLRAGEPFLKSNDVVALVGGEDMAVVAELGYLESYVQSGFSEFRIKMRSLAWEGDTVFEQRRDLNYPVLEQQLEKIGATVVIVQFGAMERFGRVDDFRRAYEKLLVRLRGSQMRRMVVLAPTPVREDRPVARQVPLDDEFTTVAKELCVGDQMLWIDPFRWVPPLSGTGSAAAQLESRDGIHLTSKCHEKLAGVILQFLQGNLEAIPAGNAARKARILDEEAIALGRERWERFHHVVAEKNRLWFNYSRPQNWAFLAGDRTNQPSSRDHIDRNKRWFPEELERFVPLIEAKEKEIWELAAKLNP